MNKMWNEKSIIEAVKTCSSSGEVHKKFSGGWKWMRRNKKFHLLSHLNKTVEAVTIQQAFGENVSSPIENSTPTQECEEAPLVKSMP